MGCEDKRGRLLDLCECKGHDGRPDPSPKDCEFYRQQFSEEVWSPEQTSRGLGDVVAKITNAVGIKSCGGCKRRQEALNRLWPFAHVDSESPRFVTSAQLMEDAKELASKLPPDTSQIIGVARSGLCVASLVAMLMHRPMGIIRQSTKDLVSAGNGWRLTGNISSAGPVVVIDDTVMAGNSFKQVMPLVRAEYPNAISAAVYVNPNAKTKPDLWVRDLPWPHLLEWNLFNSVVSPQMAVDIDGTLCKDCAPESDDDGERYVEFLTTAAPKYYIRKTSIPLIVTSRLEKYRTQTVEWLGRHGMKVDNLIMGPWSTAQERSQSDVAQFKAEHFRAFRNRKHKIKPPIFVESDPLQAERIAQLSGGIVACPAAGRCYP